MIALLIVASAALAAQQAPEPPRAGTNGIPLPRVTRYVEPGYPPIAISARIEGDVTADAVVGLDGRVERARIVRSTPLPLLDDAVLDAVRRWQFEPPVVSGSPVRSVVPVTIQFILGKRPPPVAAQVAPRDAPGSIPFAFEYHYQCTDGESVIDVAGRVFALYGDSAGTSVWTPGQFTSEELASIHAQLQPIVATFAVTHVPGGSLEQGIRRSRMACAPRFLARLSDGGSARRPFQVTTWTSGSATSGRGCSGPSPHGDRVQTASARSLAELGEQIRRIVAQKPAIRTLPRELRRCLE